MTRIHGEAIDEAVHIRDQSCEGAYRGVRGERKIRKPKHREDRGQPDGRHRQNSAGHEAVDDELENLGDHSVASGDLEELELGPGNLLVAELAVDDVADVGEIA